MLHCFIDQAMCLVVVLKVYVSLGLMAVFLQSLSHIMDASMEDLARCPGIGERKVFCSCPKRDMSFDGISAVCDALLCAIIECYDNFWCLYLKCSMFLIL